MAGLGSRFAKAGYEKPKPFIDVDGKSMIERVIENLFLNDAHYYLVANSNHIKKEKKLVDKILKEYPVTFISISELTEGTACTVLFARKFINNKTPLLIANSDQIIDLEMDKFINDSTARGLDGSILTFRDPNRNPKWSFAKVENNLVVEVREKEPISDNATVGIYFYKEGKYFVDSAIDMIINNDRTNNEFYTCPTYNYLISEKKKVGIFEIKNSEMHGLGTPEDLLDYLGTSE